MDDSRIVNKIRSFAQKYLEMDLGSIKVHCPYWMNKIQGGKVAIRGQFNGKGTSKQIKTALQKSLDEIPSNTPISVEFMAKLAKRKRIGIDCSGLIFQILETQLNTDDMRRQFNRLFPGGINRTNTNTLTQNSLSKCITKADDIAPLDIIRMNGGKHIMLVIDKTDEYVEYIHSSDKSQIKGVHTNRINIIHPDENLDQQEWIEITSKGQNYGEKYFNPLRGDCVKRLNIFHES